MANWIMTRLPFLLVGVALAALGATAFLLYASAQGPQAPVLPAQHITCGEPVSLRVEDYSLLGGTRGEEDIELARLDFCDPVHVTRDDGSHEIWFWMSAEITEQMYPYASWGYPWVDVETPFPADFREPRDAWWQPRSTIRAIPAETTYLGGDGVACPVEATNARGLRTFFHREDGFQLPVGTTHSGWVCLYFDGGQSVPNAFTVTVRPDRARVTQWVDRFYVTTEDGSYSQPPIPSISGDALCAYATFFHPDTVQPDGPCESRSDDRSGEMRQ